MCIALIIRSRPLFLMFEGQNRTGDKRLTELIAKVGCAVRSFNQNLFGRLIQPLPYGEQCFPIAPAVQSRIRGHVHRRSRYGPRPYSATHSVANFASRTRGSSVKRLYGSRKIVCFGLQRDNAFNIFNAKIVGSGGVGGCKLLHNRSLCKGHIIFICRKNATRMLCRCSLNHGKERRFFLFSVNNKGSSEYFMTTMFRVDLCETKHFRVGKRPSLLLFNMMQISNFIGR